MERKTQLDKPLNRFFPRQDQVVQPPPPSYPGKSVLCLLLPYCYCWVLA